MLYAAALLQGVARSLNRIWDLLGQWDVVGQLRPVSAALQCPGLSGLLLLPSPKEAFSAQGLEGARCQLEMASCSHGAAPQGIAAARLSWLDEGCA